MTPAPQSKSHSSPYRASYVAVTVRVIRATSSPAMAESRLKRVDVDDNPPPVSLESIFQPPGMPLAEAPPPCVLRGRVVDASRLQRLDVRHWNQEICHG